MSFTNSTFTFINCEDPSKRFSVTNDEIRQMELKINVVHKESENWKHIASHLYNFYTKIGYLGQPKSNRNVYPAEFKELLRLKDTSYRDAVESKPWKVDYEMPKVDVKAESHLKRHNSWQNYTTKVMSNADDSISNPSVHQRDYSNNLAMQMMKKLNVDTSAEYVTSAQLHMKDRFRSDVHSESSASDSKFEIAEKRMPIKHTRATSEYAEIPVEERDRRVRLWGKILAATLRRIKKAKTLEDLQYELDEETSSNEAADYVGSRYPYSEWDDNKVRDYKKQVKKAVKDRKRELGLPLSDSDEESSSDSDFLLAEAKLSSDDSDSVSDSSSGSDFEDAEKNMRPKRRGRSRKKKKKKKRKKRTSSDRPKSKSREKSSSIRDMISDAQEAYDDYKSSKRDSDEDSDDQSKKIVINLG